MLPEALQPLSPERLPGVFEHSITWEDDVWKSDPFDVQEVHQKARRKFQDVLAAVTSRDAPFPTRILLFHGQSGAGKTHLIRALRTYAHGAGTGYFGYAQMTPDVLNYAEYFLRRLVNSLEKPYDPVHRGVSGLMRLADRLVERSGTIDRGALDQLREAALEDDALSRLVVVLADQIVASPSFSGQELDINIVRALLYLQRNDPSIDQRIRHYLYGRDLTNHSHSAVGALDPQRGQDRAFEIIECLGRIMKIVDGAALVFCIDQVEDLRSFTDAEDRFQRAIRDLIQITNRVPSAIILVACLDDFYAQTREYIPQSFIDRIEQAGPVLLNGSRTADEARLIVSRRLEQVFAAEGQSAPDPVRLFGEGFMDELAGLSTRRLLEHTQARWRQIIGDVGDRGPASSTTEYGDGPEAQAIKARWERFLQIDGPEVPSEEKDLAIILVSALRIATEEVAGTLDIEVAPVDKFDDLAAIDLLVRHTGGQPAKSRLFLCNRSNQGGGLKRQIERIQVSTGGKTPVLIRASEFPPSAKGQAAQLLRKLQLDGGMRLVISPWEWERMISLQDFHARNWHEPGYNAWLKASRILTDLPSVQHLLRLDLSDVVVVDAGKGTRTGAPASKDAGFAQNWPQQAKVIPFTAAGQAPGAGASASGQAAANDMFGDPAPQVDDVDEIISLGTPIDYQTGGQTMQDLEPEPDVSISPEEDWENFTIGSCLGGETEAVSLNKHILRRHAAMIGGSGSGKTTLALSVIEQLLLRGIPVVLIDRKGDLCSYANPDVWRSADGEAPDRRGEREELASSIDVAVYTPGRTSGRPINITLLPNGIAELPEHEQQMLANVSAAALGEMLYLRRSATHQRQSGILSVALKVIGSRSRSEVRLNDLIQFLEEDNEELLELTQRMDSSGKARRDLISQLDSLRHRNAALFEGHGEALRMESLLGLGQFARSNRTRLSIVYTGFLGDNQNVLFWVAQFLSEALRFCQRNPSERLQAVIMFDEADLYIPSSSKPATKDPLESLLKRARSAGIGLMLATQSPGDLDYRSRDQITSWFIGRVREDTALKKLRAAFQSESGLDPARVLPNQTVGEFHLIQEGRVKAMKSKRSLINAEQVPFDRIEQLARETKRQEAQQLKLDLR